MEPQRYRADTTAANFLFQHSDLFGIPRPFGRLSVPLSSAFHNYHGHRRRQLSSSSAEKQTSDIYKYEEYSVEVDQTDDDSRQGDGTGAATVRRDHSVPTNQSTTRKHDYSVTELLRNDRPSSSATHDDHTDVGPPDSRRQDAPTTSPSQTTDHSLNVKQVNRSTASMLRPLVPPDTERSHRLMEWMSSDSWPCLSAFDSAAERRGGFGLYHTSPVNFMTNYNSRHLRRGTELHLPLPLFGHQYSMLRRPRKYQLWCVLNCTKLHIFNYDLDVRLIFKIILT